MKCSFCNIDMIQRGKSVESAQLSNRADDKASKNRFCCGGIIWHCPKCKNIEVELGI